LSSEKGNGNRSRFIVVVGRRPDGDGGPDDPAKRPRGADHGQKLPSGHGPKVSAARLLGEFLEKYTIHHQLLSASYSVGGPSAGYALAINTLSALMHIPVYNDFGITGAPWTKGVKRGEVGGSVIIGGQRKKTEKVLMYLRRMYMPLKNYMDLEQEFIWSTTGPRTRIFWASPISATWFRK
jgi:hypothetical protein